jgi:hypothetical protein
MSTRLQQLNLSIGKIEPKKTALLVIHMQRLLEVAFLRFWRCHGPTR